MSRLTDDWERGSNITIYTIGQGSHTADALLHLLDQHGIEKVVDVRSIPFSRHRPQFDRPALENILRRGGIEYEWLGEILGQMPACDEFYDEEGYTLYEELVNQKWFMKAIGQLEHEAGEARVALTCTEEEPDRCHRFHLLGKLLGDRGGRVLHIRRDGRIHTQDEIHAICGGNQTGLFDEPTVWRSPMPMRGGHNKSTPPTQDDWD